MNVTCKTNLDWYKQVTFPVFQNIIPRIGEKVQVNFNHVDYCNYNRIPTALEVVNVTYVSNDNAIVELWYNKDLYKLYDEDYKKYLMKQ